ncbi:hypothetical protein J6590_014266 [Homalodisca vitripennis]|nr:hypothetical protein J6590_014266 [Homalodisca vitripennis]
MSEEVRLTRCTEMSEHLKLIKRWERGRGPLHGLLTRHFNSADGANAKTGVPTESLEHLRPATEAHARTSCPDRWRWHAGHRTQDTLYKDGLSLISLGWSGAELRRMAVEPAEIKVITSSEGSKSKGRSRDGVRDQTSRRVPDRPAVSSSPATATATWMSSSCSRSVSIHLTPRPLIPCCSDRRYTR